MLLVADMTCSDSPLCSHHVCDVNGLSLGETEINDLPSKGAEPDSLKLCCL